MGYPGILFVIFKTMIFLMLTDIEVLLIGAPFFSYIALIFHSYSEYSLLFVMFFILGLKMKKEKLIILISPFIYFIIFSAIAHKDYRFILPIMPFMVLFAADGFFRYPKFIHKPHIKREIYFGLIVITLAFSCVNAFHLKTFQPKNQICEAIIWIGKQPNSERVIVTLPIYPIGPGYAYLQKNIPFNYCQILHISYYIHYSGNSTFYIVIPEHIFQENKKYISSLFELNDIILVKIFKEKHYYDDEGVYIYIGNY